MSSRRRRGVYACGRVCGRVVWLAAYDVRYCFWVWANEENAGKVMRALRKFGAPLMDLAEEDFHRPGMVFQIGTAPQRIDLLSGVDGVRYEEAVKRAVEMEVDGLKLKVISIEDLIVNKKVSGRAKDLADAEALEKLKEV